MSIKTVNILHLNGGNLLSIQNMFQTIQARANIISTPSELKHTERLIIPGVGHFDRAMQHLKREGMTEVLQELIQIRKIPVLGICLGMQLLGKSSEEGTLPGLGVLPYRTTRWTPHDSFRFKSPHNGWNTLNPVQKHPIITGISQQDAFFFLHRYRVTDAGKETVIATTEYESVFPSIVASENLIGVQFHPEKSLEAGQQVLTNFLQL